MATCPALSDTLARWRANDPTTEWVVDSAESGRWGTITPMEDRAGFIRAFAEWLLENTSPENVAWITDISLQTSGAVTALLNATALCANYERLFIDVTKRLPVLVVARGMARAGRRLAPGERAHRQHRDGHGG